MRHLLYCKQYLETLRRNTVVQTLMARYVTEDTDLAGCVLLKDTPVTIDMMGLHRNPLVWKDPATFDPERFAPGGEAEMVTKKYGTCWTPFGNGSRMCIGINFSLNEQRVFLPMLCKFCVEYKRLYNMVSLLFTDNDIFLMNNLIC